MLITPLAEHVNNNNFFLMNIEAKRKLFRNLFTTSKTTEPVRRDKLLSVKESEKVIIKDRRQEKWVSTRKEYGELRCI